MPPSFPHRLAAATRLTQAGRLGDATALLRTMLGGLVTGVGIEARSPTGSGPILDGVAEPAAPASPPQARTHPVSHSITPLRTPSRGASAPFNWMPNRTCPDGSDVSPASMSLPAGAQFLSGTFTLPDAGKVPVATPASGRMGLSALGALPGLRQPDTRPYRLYVPAGRRHGAPLVVMLHGCTQSAVDFAVGTRMNEAAEAQGCLVLWPEQVAAANASRCWRWFEAGDQHRDQGEPALVAGLVRQIIAEYDVDPARVYVAGLSAGGAAAAVLGETYPDLFAAIGVHSGLACGAAHDAVSAFTAMRRAPVSPASTRAGAPNRSGSGAAARTGSGSLDVSAGTGSGQPVPKPRAIVFHGDADRTVHPGNADAVIARIAPELSWTRHSESGRVPGGHTFERIRQTAPDGITMLEQWCVHGAGHAWSGGSTAGSYTDPLGPDATREMLRFFLERPRTSTEGADLSGTTC